MIWLKRRTVWKMKRGSADLAVTVLMTLVANFLVEPSKNHRQPDVAVRSKSKDEGNKKKKRNYSRSHVKLN